MAPLFFSFVRASVVKFIGNFSDVGDIPIVIYFNQQHLQTYLDEMDEYQFQIKQERYCREPCQGYKNCHGQLNTALARC